MFSLGIQCSSTSLKTFNETARKLENSEAQNNHSENEPGVNDPPQSKINDEQINKISSGASLNIGYSTNSEVKTPKVWKSQRLEGSKKMGREPYVPPNSVSKPLHYGKVQIIKGSDIRLEGNWREKASPGLNSRFNAPVNQSKPINLNAPLQDLKPKSNKIIDEILHLLQQGKVEACEKFLAEMLQGGFVPTLVFFNTLIDMFVKTNNVDNAWNVMAAMDQPESLIKPDVITYNTLMKIYLKDRFLTYKMQHNGIRPDAPNYSTLKKECRKNINLIEECRNLYEIMLKENVQPDVITFNTMLNIYGANGKLKDCLALLGQMREKPVTPNTFTYNTVLRTCVKKGTLKDCEIILEDMQRENVPRNEATYTILMGYHANNDNLDGALDLLEEMKTKGIKPDELTYSLLIRLCLKNESLEHCDKLLKEMLPVVKFEKSARNDLRGLYHAVINAYLYNGRQISGILGDMENAGLKFDIDTFNILLKYYVEKKNTQWVNDLLNDMTKYNIKPNDVSHEILSSVEIFHALRKSLK